MGVERVADMLQNKGKLQFLFRPKTFQFFMRIAHGVSGDRPLRQERKSIR